MVRSALKSECREGIRPDAGKDIKQQHGLMACVKLIARNLTDCRYELAGGYPMPGRAFYGEIDLKF